MEYVLKLYTRGGAPASPAILASESLIEADDEADAIVKAQAASSQFGARSGFARLLLSAEHITVWCSDAQAESPAAPDVGSRAAPLVVIGACIGTLLGLLVVGKLHF